MPPYGRKRALSPLRRSRRRPSCSTARDHHIPPPSRGENGGLCPHPPKGPVPWVSLFGERPTSLTSGTASYGRKRDLSRQNVPQRPPVAKTVLQPRPRPPYSPAIPRGERRALPAPAQGTSPLGIPFWGAAVIFPVTPVPQNAAGGKPLLVGLPPSAPSTAPTGTKRRTPTPCSWGGCSSNPSQRHRPPALPARPASLPEW